MNIHQLCKRALGGVLAAALALGAGLASAGTASAQNASDTTGVANVTFVQGYATIVRGDSGTQVDATVNAPLLPGDYLSTAGGSRAEVAFDGISMLRLAANTQVRFVNLNWNTREVQLASGTAVLSELNGADGNPQIDTPSVSVRPDQSGDYRVSVLGNGQTLVTVRSGAATVLTGAGDQTLAPGTTLVADGAYGNPTISMQGAIAFDGFDTFNADRDRTEISWLNSTPYLSPQLAGYTDFAQYGRWYNVSGYGWSWAPYNQSADWMPYSNGQWVWEPGYGYTWVGNEPWGYAPYHYGNWYYAPSYSQWMWQPPAYQYQDATSALVSSWLPALVGFFLTGGNPAYAAAYNPATPYGYANIGWVPLAPGEAYQPWYGFGGSFPATSVAPMNVTNVVNVYKNIRYVRVVRVIPVSRFRNGQFAHPIVIRRTQLRHIAAVRGAVPVVPTRALLHPTNRTVRTVTISPRFDRAHLRTAFAAKAPAVARTTFARQADAVHAVVNSKPRVVSPAVFRTETKPAPEYRPPTRHAPMQAPVMPHRTVAHPTVTHPTQTHPAATHTMAPFTRRTAAPFLREATPMHPAIVPQRTAAPAPRHTMVPAPRAPAPAPRRTMVPFEQRGATPPEHRPATQPSRHPAPRRTHPAASSPPARA